MIKYFCKTFSQLTLDELYKIMELRQRVFVVEQDCPYIDADGKDQKAHHLMGIDEQGELLSYARLLPKGISYTGYLSIGRVITAPIIRGKGEGKTLMLEAIKRIKIIAPNTPIKLSAQTYAIPFYSALGFKPVGEEYLEDNIPHIAMILT